MQTCQNLNFFYHDQILKYNVRVISSSNTYDFSDESEIEDPLVYVKGKRCHGLETRDSRVLGTARPRAVLACGEKKIFFLHPMQQAVVRHHKCRYL